MEPRDVTALADTLANKAERWGMHAAVEKVDFARQENRSKV